MTREKSLETVVTLMMAGAVLFLIFRANWLLYVGIALGLTGLFSRTLSMRLAQLWLALAEKIGWVVSRIILLLIYVFLLLPIAFLVRLSKRDPMQRSRQDKASYFIVRNHTFQARDLSNPW